MISAQMTSGAHTAASFSEMNSVSIRDRFHDYHTSNAMATHSHLD